jgi:hypothetical protein
MLGLHANCTYRQFFSGTLKQFKKEETYKGFKGRNQVRLKNDEIIDAIGEGRQLHLSWRADYLYLLLQSLRSILLH